MDTTTTKISIPTNGDKEMTKLQPPSFFYFIPKSLIQISIMLTGILVIYQNELRIIFEKATSFSAGNIANFVLVLPLLMAYVIYRNRKTLTLQDQKRRKILTLDEIVGIILVSCAIFIFIYGSETFYILEYHILSMVTFGIGSTIFLFDIATFKKVSFVFVLAIFLIPIPAEFLTVLVSDISPINTIMIHNLLDIFGIDVTSDFITGYPTITAQNESEEQFTWHIGESSSGLYSMLTLLSLGLFLAYIMQGKIWKQLVVFVLGFPILFFLNILRISTMITLWYYFDETVSESFHMISGSIMIAVCTFVLLIIGTKLLRLELLKNIRNTKQCKNYYISKVSHIIPSRHDGQFQRDNKIKNLIKTSLFALVVIVAFSQIIPNTNADDSLFAANNVQLEKINLTLISEQESTVLLPQIQNWDLQYSYRDVEFERDADMHLALWLKYTVVNNDSFSIKDNSVLFGGVEIWDFVHRWESSLVWPGRPAAALFEQKDIEILDGTTGRLVVYQMPNTEKTDAVLYWVKEIPYINNHNVERKYVHLVVWSNVDYLVSLGLVDKVDDVESIEKLFLTLARPMEVYWEKENILLIAGSEDNLLLTGLNPQKTESEDAKITPSWISVIANKWAKQGNDIGNNDDLIHAIQFLIDNETLQKSNIPKESSAISISEKTINYVPNWFKQNVKWWQANHISEKEILDAIQHMLDNNIIVIEKNNEISENETIQTQHDPDKQIAQANLLAEEYNFIQAIKVYDRIIQESPNNVSAIIGKANTLLTMRQISDAIEQYDKVLEIDPDNENAINGKANAYVADTKFKDAIQLYDQSLEINPENINAILGKGVALIHIEQKQDALLLFDLILTIDPDNVNTKKLKEKHSKLENNPLLANQSKRLSDIEKMYLEAEDIFLQERYDDASSLYTTILEIEPRYANAIGGQAAVFHRTGEYDKALEYYNKAIELEPENLYFLGDKANLLVQLGLIDESITEFKKILEIKPFHLGALNGMANAYSHFGNYEKELYYREQVLRVDFNNTDGLVGKGNAYAGLEKYDDAILYYDKTLDVDSENVNAINGKANVYFAIGKIKESIKWYNKALEIDPQNVNAINGKNNVLSKVTNSSISPSEDADLNFQMEN